MKKLSFFFTVLLVASGALTVCSSGSNPQPVQFPTSTGNYTNISPSQLNAMLGEEDFLLVNVHIPYEGEIAHTDLFIPYDMIEDNLKQLSPDKQSKIVVYCRSGSMSATAARMLVRLGYTDVYNLTGGMYAWEAQGYQLLTKPQQ